MRGTPLRAWCIPALLLVVCAGTGCVSIKPGPVVRVEGLRLRAIGPDAAEGDLSVRIWTDRPEPVSLTDFQYSLFIAGSSAFSGRWAALAAAPDEAIIRVLPVVIPLSMLPPGATPLPEASTAEQPEPAATSVPLNWSVSGTVGWEDPERLARILFDLGFANPRTDFSGRGSRLDLAAPAP